MVKKLVGVKKDYESIYQDIIRDTRTLKRDDKLSAYKAFYKRIAKVADQRLVEIENLANKKGYEHVEQWAYKNAMREIRGIFGDNAKRFNRKLPDDLRVVYKDINRVMEFLNAPTSSKQGIDEVYGKRADTINRKYGTNVNWETIGNIYNSTLYKKTDTNGYGSKTCVKAIGIIQANKRQIAKVLKGHEDDRKKVISFQVSDSELERTVNNMLQYYKTDVLKILKRI